MRAPKFWQSRNLISTALWPFSYIYYLCCRISKICINTYNANPLPVICIGNVTAGGAGKTPIAISLAKFYIARGMKPVFLSRGYGVKIEAPIIVDLAKHKSINVGDEALILAKTATTIVCPDRKISANIAKKLGADILIMDDGLQNNSIRKDKSILVIDGSYGIGNGYMLPAGPLREPLSEVLKRVESVIIVGGDRHNIEQKIGMHVFDMPVFNAEITSSFPGEIKNRRIIAFSGIGNPQKFFATLDSFNVIMNMPFPDHYSYKKRDIEKLLSIAAKENAILVTTEKDMVRIESISNQIEANWREKIFFVPIEVKMPSDFYTLFSNIASHRAT